VYLINRTNDGSDLDVVHQRPGGSIARRTDFRTKVGLRFAETARARGIS